MLAALTRTRPLKWVWSQRFALIYWGLGAAFVVRIACSHDPRSGFTALELFGDQFAAQRVPEIRDLPVYTYQHSSGFDGQFYAQLAVVGDPFRPELRTALDNPAYRSTRILLPIVAHVAGFGRPALVLDAYALANLVAWIALAWVSARWWFPPTSLDPLIRWTGTMFGAGALVSVVRGLVDGPALLVIALGVRCLELNRRWLAASLLGAAGLVRETSVLAATAFADPDRLTPKSWHKVVLPAVACALPIALWTAVLVAHYGGMNGGALAPPFVGVVRELGTIGSLLREGRLYSARDKIYVVVAIAFQIGVVIGRPRPAVAWWRVGAAFALLTVFFAPELWEDLNGAPRYVLPLTLAFNFLTPRGSVWLPVLLAGNLTVLSAPRVLGTIPPFDDVTRRVPGVSCEYLSGWYGPQHRATRVWRWAAGPAVLALHNSQPVAARVRLDFDMSAAGDRTVAVSGADLRRSFTLQAGQRVHVQLPSLLVPPGDLQLTFETNDPPWIEPGLGGRELSYSAENLTIDSETAPR